MVSPWEDQKMKGLIFDFGGVISKTLFETHALTEVVLGLVPNTLQWRGPFDPANDSLWQRLQRNEISERDYWLTRSKEVGAMLGENWTDMQTLVKRSRSADPDQVIRPEVAIVINQVKERGLKLAILSNELDMFYGKELRSKLQILKNFDAIVDATYTGILKPDARAYQFALDAIGLSAPECLFIDDQKRNIDGALAVGLACVHFDVMNPSASCLEIQRFMAS
jgi:putative hydrolase of the HAD superfamily